MATIVHKALMQNFNMIKINFLGLRVPIDILGLILHKMVMSTEDLKFIY